MSWNHRVVETLEGGQRILAIHEVQYDVAGRPVDHEEPTIVDGETIDEMRTLLDGMRAALDLPVLSAADFALGRARSGPVSVEPFAVVA